MARARHDDLGPHVIKLLLYLAGLLVALIVVNILLVREVSREKRLMGRRGRQDGRS
jgi:hypothetical protein